MKLLICTQKVDANDPVLGFFVRWIEDFAKHCENVDVVCLHKGEYSLPDHVRVHALGKGKIMRALGVLYYAQSLKYDAVFVHMNQEYVLLSGWLWKLTGRRVYLWRNHYAGSIFTDMAAAFCDKIFYTSKFSYTAKYKKAVQMPVGIDTHLFKLLEETTRGPRSILFLARMSPAKRPDMFIDALYTLKQKGISFRASMYGSPLPQDREYYTRLTQKAQEIGIGVYPAIANQDTPRIYNAHSIFVNCSPSGMYDKTIYEAAACGCLPLAASEDWAARVGEEFFFRDAQELATKLENMLALSEDEIIAMYSRVEKHVHENDLRTLSNRLIAEIK